MQMPHSTYRASASASAEGTSEEVAHFFGKNASIVPFFASFLLFLAFLLSLDLPAALENAPRLAPKPAREPHPSVGESGQRVQVTDAPNGSALSSSSESSRLRLPQDFPSEHGGAAGMDGSWHALGCGCCGLFRAALRCALPRSGAGCLLAAAARGLLRSRRLAFRSGRRLGLGFRLGLALARRTGAAPLRSRLERFVVGVLILVVGLGFRLFGLFRLF
eukprot:COSAG06_NODE_5611_length_3363_cov_2.002757_4_plen_219_part_00